MSGTRCRLVVTTLRDGELKERWVSPNIIADDEAMIAIAKEAFLHTVDKWEVYFVDGIAVCVKGPTRREINVMRFSAMADVVTAGVQDNP